MMKPMLENSGPRWAQRLPDILPPSEGERLLSTMLESTPDPVWAKDLDGRYILTNRAYLDLFGTTAEELLGLDDRDRFEPAVAEALRDNDRQVLQAGRPLQFEERAPVGDEERIYLSVKFPLRGDGGRIYGVGGISTDVTHYARSAGSARAADQRKDAFLAMLGHELRGPLSILRHAVQLQRELIERGEDPLPALEMVDRQLDQATRLVDDLMDVARVTHGKIRLERRRLDLSRLIEDSVTDARRRVAASSLELTVDLPAEPVWVEGDRDRLAQVLSNLLDNAVKYTHQGGITVTLRCSGEEAAVSVCDTGIGLETDALDGLFDPFWQADGGHERRQGGLGLGLALVRRLVELHGGTVEAESDGPGRGSCFTVRLPAA